MISTLNVFLLYWLALQELELFVREAFVVIKAAVNP